MENIILEQLSNFFKYSCKLRNYFSRTNWIERCFKEKDNIHIRGYFYSKESANINFYIYFLEIRT